MNYQQLTTQERALQEAMAILLTKRVSVSEESGFAWTKLDRARTYLCTQAKTIELRLAEYFAEEVPA